MMLRGKLQAKSVVKVYTVAMDSEQDAGPDLPDAETPENDTDVDTEPLQRSQNAIDQAREAAREAFKDNPPDADPTEPDNAQEPAEPAGSES
jgi:hypothetical protein